MKHLRRLLWAAVLLAVIGAALAIMHYQPRDEGGTESATTQEYPIGGPFELVDQGGRTVTDETFRGKWLLVFFGYTYCPDVCPTTLAEVAQTLESLGPLADRIQPLFISVDPERDTPESLRQYTDTFDARILGLTGSPKQIGEAAMKYRVYYKKIGDGADYAMEHTSIIYVMAPDGRFATHFSYQTGPERMTEKLRQLVKK